MMQKNLPNILIVTTLLMVLAACSSRVPVVDYPDQEIITRQTLTLEQVETSIIQAGKVRDWVMRVKAPGHIVATLSAAPRVAELDIRYTTKTYSITYKDSTGMEYKKGKIGNRYNKWVANLDRDIRRSFPP